MGEAGFEGIRNLVTRRQNTVTQYIATRPILDLCERTTRRLGARVSQRWWEQAKIKSEGKKKRAVEVAAVSESESELDLESNADPGGEEESRGAIGLSGAEWSGSEE